MSDEDFEDFREMVRWGGLEDCPPELSVELVRRLRIIQETFERHGVTNPDDAPLDVQRAIFKEVKRRVWKPGPKRPELRPGQFNRYLYLIHHIDNRDGKIEAAFQDVAADLGETESWVRKKYYELRRRDREWMENPQLKKFKKLLEES